MVASDLTKSIMRTWKAKVLHANKRITSTVSILLSAFLIKAVILFALLPLSANILPPNYGVGFGDLYDLIATNLAQGIGYRVEPSTSETMMREPGYPLFLVGVFRIGGYHIETARLANLMLAFGIAFMMINLTRRVVENEMTALIATLLFLFHPGILIAEARGGVEIAFIFVVVLFMMAIHHAVVKGNPWRYFVAGLVLGIVVLVRSTPFLFPVFLLAYLFLAESSTRNRLKLVSNIGVLVLGMAIVMSPWVIRNYMLVQEFVPTSTVQGVAAQEGLYTCQHLSFEREFRAVQQEAALERNESASQLKVPFVGYYYQYFYSARDEIAFNKSLLWRVGMEYRQSPSLLVRCVGKNLLNFWFLGKTWRSTWLNALIQLPLLGLALNGIHVLWKRGLLRRVGIMLTFIIYLVAVHAPIIAHARHSIPVVPFLTILASVSLISIWHRTERIFKRVPDELSV